VDAARCWSPLGRRREAGEAIRAVGARLRGRAKGDLSPVTEADRAAEAIILERLPGCAPAFR
jgi:fructose-1,6-bisphosphatase/inositol monophosphatase family enzyme